MNFSMDFTPDFFTQRYSAAAFSSPSCLKNVLNVLKKLNCMKFFLLLVSMLPASAFANFTSHPTAVDSDGKYTLAWTKPGRPVVSWWLTESKNGAAAKRIANGGTSAAVTGRGDGVYTYNLWYRTSVFNPKTQEPDEKQFIRDTVKVTVSVALDPPAKPSVPPNNSSGSYSVSWSSVSNADYYTLRELKQGGAARSYDKLSRSSHRISGQKQGRYTYSVRACNRNTCSAYSSGATVRVAFAPSSAPKFSAKRSFQTYGTHGKLNLGWAALSGADRYEVRELTPGYVKDHRAQTASAHIFSSRPAGKTYSFQLRGCNFVGCGPWSVKTAFTLSRASSVSGTAQSRNGKITLRFLATARDFVRIRENDKLINARHGADTLILQRGDGTYRYQVDSCTQVDPAPPVCSGFGLAYTAQVLKIPGPPASLSVPTLHGSISVAVSWAVAAGTVQQYDMQYKKTTSSTWKTVTTSASRRNASFAVGAGSYQVRVAACNSLGADRRCSTWRNAAKLVVARPARPPALTLASEDNDGAYAVTWAGVGNTQRYTLQERVGSGAWKTLQDSSARSISLSSKGNNTYAYRVRACNAIGCSAYASKSVSVALIPGVPPSLTASATSANGSFSLSWAAASGSVTAYRVERQNSGVWSQVASSSGRNYTDTKIADGVYRYRVRACKVVASVTSCSGYRSAVNTSVVANAPAAPATISGIPATSTEGSFTVSWALVSGNVDRYQLQQQHNGGSWTTIYSGSGKSHALNKLSDAGYIYRVRACNSVGSYTACSAYRNSGVVIVARTPTTPSSITLPVLHGSTRVSVSWAKASGAVTHYDVSSRKDSGVWQSVYSGAALSRMLTVSAGRYTLRARACNRVSTFTTCSAWRNSSLLTVAMPAAPSPRLASTDVDGSYTLSWPRVVNVKNYNVQERVGSGAWRNVQDSAALSFALTGKENNSYTYRVRACNDIGCSSYRSKSIVVALTPGIPASISPPTSTALGIRWGLASGKVSVYDVDQRLGNGAWVAVYDGAALSTALSRIAVGSYVFRVRACNTVATFTNCSAWRESAVVELQAPATPIISVPAQAQGPYNMTWTRVGATTRYTLQERLAAGAWMTLQDNNSLSHSVKVRANNRYSYRVRACNAVACSAFSSVKTLDLALNPGVPPSISVPAQHGSPELTVSWGKAAGAFTHYVLQQQREAAQWREVYQGLDRSRSLAGLGLGNYRYRVKACQTSGDFTNCSAWRVSTALKLLLPPTPTLSLPKDDADGRYRVSWTAVVAATRYDLQQRKAGGAWQAVLESAATHFDAEVSFDAYDYRIRACNALGCSDYSSASEIIAGPPLADWARVGGTLLDAAIVEAVVPSGDNNVGALKGSGDVSGGAASYRIPITVVPGRKGMQPAIALSYSSSSGNGLMGVGWSLSGGSNISRCGAATAIDGFSAGVQYDAQRDRLCLDGQRLVVVSGIYGVSGSVYRTEHDSFARVTQSGDINSPSASFKVETKAGRINHYGALSNARHNAAGRSEVLSWAINASVDRSGNNIHYRYNHHGDGEYTLDEILYTGSGVSDGDRKVKYTYESRSDGAGLSDYSTSYLAGGKSRVTQRLKQVSTYYQTTLVRRYTLDYGQMSLSSGRTLLRSVQECAYQNNLAQCLPKTVFEWQEAAPRYAFEPIEFVDSSGSTVGLTNSPYIATLAPRGDHDGDGTRDWPVIDGSPGMQVNAEGELLSTHNASLGYCFRPYNSANRRCLEGDFNQDGRTDEFTTTRTWGSDGVFKIRYAGSSSWTSTGISNTHFVEEPLAIADFNGDGWPDIAFREVEGAYARTAKLWFFLHTQDLAAPFTMAKRVEVMEYGVSSVEGVVNLVHDAQIVGDLDGNGFADVVVSLTGGGVPALPRPYKILFTEVAADGGVSFREHVFDGLIDLKGSVGSANFFHDVNADGLVDWLSVGNNLNLMVKTNLGGTFASTWTDLNVRLPMRQMAYFAAPQEPDFKWLPQLGKTLTLDYNGDGRAELLYADAVVASSCSEILHYKDGSLGEHWLCDDALWSAIQGHNDPEAVTNVASDVYDTSTRRYKAIYFDDEANGDIRAQVKETAIQAAVTQRMVVDATGNGLSDVVSTFACQRPECRWNTDAPNESGVVRDASITNVPYITRNLGAWTGPSKDASGKFNYAAIDVLRQTSDGVGVENHWVYRPLASDTYDSRNPGDNMFYEADHAYVNAGDISGNDRDHFHFASSMLVVAEHKVSNPNDGLNARLFRYRGATFNNKGRAFMGFRTIIVEDMTNKLKTRTDFHQKWPLVGQVEHSCTWLSAESEQVDNCAKAISESTIDYEVKSPTSVSRWVGAASTTQINRDLNSRAALSTRVNAASFDNYGNTLTQSGTLTHHSSAGVNYGVHSSASSNDFTVDENAWWLNKLNFSINSTESVSGRSDVSIASGTDLPKSLRTDFKWYENTRLPKRATVSGGAITETEYTSHGLPEKVTVWAGDVGKRQILNGYSSDGYFIKSITQFAAAEPSADDHVSMIQVDPLHGQPLRVETQMSESTSLVAETRYDAFHRPVYVKAPGQPAARTIFAWCDSTCASLSNNYGVGKVAYTLTQYQQGSPTQTRYVTPLGVTVLSRHQGFDGESIYTKQAVDDSGRERFMSIPFKAADVSALPRYTPGEASHIGTHYVSYDALGRNTQKRVDQANGERFATTYTHDLFTTTIKADRLSLSRSYNAQGQLMRTVDALQGTTYYAYDGAGNPILLQDPLGNRIVSEFDALGRKRYVNDPNMGRKSFVYNGLGELTAQTDANGDTLSYTLDNFGRNTARLLNGKAESQWVYDIRGKGLLASESRNGQRKEFYFDSLYRPSRTHYDIDGEGFDIRTYYDGHYGRVKGLEYPEGLKIAYEYSEWGYLSAQKNASTSYEYQRISAQDAYGNITQSSLGAVVKETTEFYPNSNQMKRIQAANFLETLHDIAYEQYDIFGNLERKKNRYDGTSTTETFEYDDLHRLTLSTRSGVASHVVDYSYDALGNLTGKSDYASRYTYTGTGACGSKPNAVCSVAKVGGGNATFGYDANGNLTRGDGKTLSYNVDNKPLTVSANGISSRFYYGADRMRYKQVRTGLPGGEESTVYLDKAVEVIRQGSTRKTRFYLGDRVVLEKRLADSTAATYTLSYLLKDRLGSVATVVDHNGIEVERRGFDPFGKPRDGDWQDKNDAIIGSSTTHRGFTGHEHLDGQKMIHMNGRIYDYQLGRFYSVDPYIQSPQNSQSLNPYSYIMNNPLAGVDPTGYTSCPTGSKTSACGDSQKAKEVEKKIKVTGTGRTVTIKASQSSDGKVTFSISGGNGSDRGKVGGHIANQLSASGYSVNVSTSDIGSQQGGSFKGSSGGQLGSGSDTAAGAMVGAVGRFSSDSQEGSESESVGQKGIRNGAGRGHRPGKVHLTSEERAERVVTAGLGVGGVVLCIATACTGTALIATIGSTTFAADQFMSMTDKTSPITEGLQLVGLSQENAVLTRDVAAATMNVFHPVQRGAGVFRSISETGSISMTGLDKISDFVWITSSSIALGSFGND